MYATLRKKIIAIGTCLLVALSIITLRLYQLQVLNQEEYAYKCKRNFLKTSTLAPARGSFFDVNHRLLATNQPLFTLLWQGTGASSLSNEHKELLSTISALAGVDLTTHSYMTSISRAERKYTKIPLLYAVDYETFCKMSEHCAHAQNITFEHTFKRVYPYGSIASHILGYLGRSDHARSIGKSGLEKYFQDDLQGKYGHATHITTAGGRQLDVYEEQSAQPGSDVTLTIDAELQSSVEKLFQNDQAGACVLLDPFNGALKVLCSYPHFNPNLFSASLSPEAWKEIITQDNPFLNRALAATYPPASLFKLVTFAAGLEQKVITPESMFRCTGSVTFGDKVFYCQRRSGHGLISCKTSLAFSCNIPCYKIGQRLSIDLIAAYAHRFGLGKSTDFMLPEHQGFVPTEGWKRTVLHERWWPGETLCVCIGQSYILVTPLQVARMIGSIFTGFLVKPRLLIDEAISRKRLRISKKTRTFLQGSMYEAIQLGTAKMFRSLSAFKLFGKTGTAQTIKLQNQQMFKAHQEHGWFAVYFQYKNEQPLVLVVLVEHAGSSLPARDIAKKFLKAYEKRAQAL